MGHPMTSMAAMRSFRRDPSVTARELPKGTVRRILGIARPYRRELIFFLLLVVASSVIGVITPLLAGDIVNRIAGLHGTAGGIVRIALIIAGLAVARRGDLAGHPLVLRADRRGRHLRPAQPGVRARAAHAGRVLHPHADRRAGQPAEQRRHRRPAGVHLDAVGRRLQRDRAGAHRRRDVLAVLADHPAVADPGAAVRAARRGGSASGCRRSPGSPTGSTRR